jgi:phage FluMu protein gp41
VTINDLIQYIDTDLSLDDIRALSRDDLAELNRALYHWERITDRELMASKEEEPE